MLGRRALAWVLIGAALASCSEDPPLPRIPLEGSSPAAAPRPSTVESTLPNNFDDPATLELVVRDRAGRPLADVDVILRRVRGKTERLTSDARGRIRVRRPPGHYRARVPVGCIERREVNEGPRSIRMGLAAGRAHRVHLRVRSRRRYMGGPPVRSSTPAPWPRGRTVTLRFLLEDRCQGDEAPRTSFTDLRWRPSSNLQVVDRGPMRSDAQATSTVRVRCTGPGDASLWLQARDDPRDRVDLLAQSPPSPFDVDATWCA